DAGQGGGEHVDDHGRGDDATYVGIPKPSAGHHPYQYRKYGSVDEADAEFAADHAPGVVDVQILRRQRAHRDGHGLRSRISAHAGDDRHQHRKRNDVLYGAIKKADHRGGQEGGHQVDQQPGHARARRRQHRVGQFLVTNAAHAHQIFFGFLLDHVDHVIDGQDADKPVVLVHDGGGQKVILLEFARRLLLVHGGGNGVARLMHHVLDLHRAFGAQDLIEIHRAKQLEGRVDDENLAEPVRQILVFTHVVDGLADRPERRHCDELRLHAPAGRLFRIVESPPQPDPLGEGELREDFVLILLVEVFQDVDGVVGIELLNRLRDLRVRQVIHDVEANRFVNLGQGAEIEVCAQQAHKLPPLLWQQGLKQIAQLRRMQGGDIALEGGSVALGNGCTDLREKRRTDHAVLVIYVGARALGRGHSLVFVLAVHRLLPMPESAKGCAQALTCNARQYQTKCAFSCLMRAG